MISSYEWNAQSSTSFHYIAVKVSEQRTCGIVWNSGQFTSDRLKIDLFNALIMNTISLAHLFHNFKSAGHYRIVEDGQQRSTNAKGA